MHLVYPGHKILHNHCFKFLLGITVIDSGYAVLGVNKLHYGACENGVLLMVRNNNYY